MKLLVKVAQSALKQKDTNRRHFWGWLNAVFNKYVYLYQSCILVNRRLFSYSSTGVYYKYFDGDIMRIIYIYYIFEKGTVPEFLNF